jgi:hypothetical protein
MSLFTIALLLFLSIAIVVQSFHHHHHHQKYNKYNILKSNVDIDIKNNILCQFLEDAKSLRAVRHVVQGNGAILETAGSFDTLRYSDIKDKGKLATLSSDVPLFECHIRLYEIKQVKLLEIVKFDRKLHIIRFLLDSGLTALSSILMNTDDINEIEKWEALKKKYGTEITIRQ